MHVNKSLFQPAVSIAILAAGLSFGAALPAGAQTRVGGTQFPQPTDGVRRFPAVAYDSVNNAYLVAWGLSTVGARFVSADGVPLSTRETLSGVGGATRVACGGGTCLVAWIQEPTSVMGRLVRYQGGAVQLLTSPFVISANGASKLSSAAPAVAYSSSGNGEFLVAWTEFAPGIRISGQRVTMSGSLAGSEIPVANSSAYQGFPSLTYNSTDHEYVVAYHSENASGLNIVATRRIQPATGAILGSSNLQSGVFEQYPEIAYNSTNNQFLTITWHGGGGWMVHGQLSNSDAQPIGSLLTLATGSGGDGIGLAYNSTSNSYLAVFLSTTNDEIWGVNVSSTGTPGSRFQVTVSGASASTFSTQPQAAGSTRADRWLVAASWGYKAVMSQLVQRGGGGTGTGGPPPAPALVSPTGTINTPSPTYTWRASAGATYYQLWVTDSSGTARVQTWYTASSACGSGSTCSATPNSGLAPGRGYWWVQAWNPSGYSPWSAEMSFTLANDLPVAISPSGTVSTAPILFTWSAVPGATMYYLWVNDASGPKFQGWILSSTACATGASTCSVNASPPLFAGNGYWWVLAWGPTTGYSPWSARRSFTIAPLTAAPQLLTPSGVLSGTSIEFGWLPSANATMYYLWVNDSTGTRVQEWLTASAVCTSGICTRTISPSLSSGAGIWWVQPWSSTGGYGPWSEPLTFVR